MQCRKLLIGGADEENKMRRKRGNGWRGMDDEDDGCWPRGSAVKVGGVMY